MQGRKLRKKDSEPCHDRPCLSIFLVFELWALSFVLFLLLSVGRLLGEQPLGGELGERTVAVDPGLVGRLVEAEILFEKGRPPRMSYLFKHALIQDAAGNFYSTTSGGGAHNKGTVFELSPSSNGWTKTTLFSFNGKDGNAPQAGLILSGGNLYGTTTLGGADGHGTVFQLTLPIAVVGS